MIPIQIRFRRDQFEVFQGDLPLISYDCIRQAKAFRSALDRALEEGMRPSVAFAFAVETARLEPEMNCQTEAIDEHFTPA